MPINFPDSPAENDSFTSGGKKWIFNGTVWTLVTANSYTIPTGEVTTAKILDANVTAAKLASGAAVSNIGYTPANIAGPTFTGTVVLPSTTSIGTVSSTEIGYVDGVTSAIQTQLDSKLTTTTAVTSNRNAIINGSMNVWQRGTSFTSFNAYAADRWYITGSANFTFSRQVTGSTLPQFAYCSRMQRNSGSTDVTAAQLGYALETADSLRFAGKTITVSFWARAGANYSGTSNALYYVLATGTGTDQRLLGSGFTGTAYSVVNLVTLTTSWQRFSYTTTVPSTATEISHYFQANLNAGTAGANDFWDVTGVQLEEGSIATPFEFEDIGTTLAKCQRYYEKTYNLGTAVGTATFTGMVGNDVNGATTNEYIIFRIRYEVRKRAAPTITTYDAAGNSGKATRYSIIGAGTDNTAVGVDFIGESSFRAYIGTGLANNSGFNLHYTASAEL